MKKLLPILTIALVLSNNLRAQFPSFTFSTYNNDIKRVGMVYKDGKYYNSNNDAAQSKLNSVPYNHWFQSGPHNTYEHYEPALGLKSLNDYLLNVSSLIEIDIHPIYNTNWLVYHKANDEKVNCGANGLEQNVTLSTTLSVIKSFHDKNPNHHVITLWIELKGSDIWDKGKPETLNNIFEKHLGESFIYSPSKFLAKNKSSNLRQAADNGWPTLGELRGKIIIILFNHNQKNSLLIDYNKLKNEYAFIAPNMYGDKNKHGIVDQPTDFNDVTKKDIIFYSLEGDNYADHCYGLEIFRANRVSSTFYVNSTEESTPGVSEYRDFLIQHARWGKDKNTESHNQPYHYSGFLSNESNAGSIAKFKSGDNYLTINKETLNLKKCEAKDAPYFAVIDVWIDYDKTGQFPLGSTDSNRAYIIQPVTNMDTEFPNEKIIEAKGVYSPKNKHVEGREIILYEREKTKEKIRSKDQYWVFEQLKDGKFVIKNKFYGSYICTGANNSLVLKKDIKNAKEWTVE